MMWKQSEEIRGTWWEFRKGSLVVVRVWVLELTRPEFPCKAGHLSHVFSFVWCNKSRRFILSSYVDHIRSKPVLETQIPTLVKQIATEWRLARREEQKRGWEVAADTEPEVGGSGHGSEWWPPGDRGSLGSTDIFNSLLTVALWESGLYIRRAAFIF